jgi:hypothetical protein
MKKTVLVVLMSLMFATPCLAENVKPDGLFSIEGTLWAIEGEDGESFGFYEGNVHISIEMNLCIEIMSSSYHDYLIFSLFSYKVDAGVTPNPYKIKCTGILFPILGIGFAIENDDQGGSKYKRQYLFNKANDSWQPDSWCLPMH